MSIGNGDRPSAGVGAVLEQPRHLQGARGRKPIDLTAAETAARDLLEALGADLGADGLRETPGRIARAYAELLTPIPFNVTTFPNDEGYDELVVVRDIPFQSLCMHHMLPFHGIAHVAYLPDERIVGLSKLGRVVDLFARDLQVQRAADDPGRRLARRSACPARGRRDHRGRAPLHVVAGGAESRLPDGDVCAPRIGQG